MEATRQIFWNVNGRATMYGLALITLLIFSLGVINKVRNWNQGRPVVLDHTLLRVKDLLLYLMKPKKVIKSKFHRRVHMAIVYGFIILLLSTMVIALQDLFHLHLYFGIRYLVLSLFSDLSGLLVMIGVIMSAYKRFINNLDQLKETVDRAITLLLLFCILLTGFLLEGLRVYATSDPWAVWRPLGLLLAVSARKLGLTIGQAHSIYPFLWYIHMLLAFGFIAYIPNSKLFHMFASPLTIFLKPLSTSGVSLPSGSNDSGTARLKDFSKKQLIELDACIACLRCEKHCPSFESGGPLSPRAMVQDLKKFSHRGLPFTVSRQVTFGSELVGQTISKDSLLACTTCGICEKQCPMLVKHVTRIVDLRQSLITEEYPTEIQVLFHNVASQGNPWAKQQEAGNRSNLHMQVPHITEKGNADVLYWAGCFGSYESRAQQVAEAMFQVLRKAGIDFAIVGSEEKCCGDAVRRLGNEELFQRLAKENITVLNRASFNTIVTQCPHCYNTLKNEYPQFGGSYRVMHHSQFLLKLIESGKIKPKGASNLIATFHDPCYLGRYNNIYGEPRKVLSAIEGLKVVEMKNNYAKSACCGGGGGRFWLNDREQYQVNLIRANEAVKTGPDIVVSACPLCLNNLSKAVNSLNPAIRNLDIAEIVNDKIS